MLMTYTGQVYPIRQYYPYISEEMAVKWVNISNDVRNLKLTVEEHAVILAICLTFTGKSKGVGGGGGRTKRSKGGRGRNTVEKMKQIGKTIRKKKQYQVQQSYYWELLMC